MGSKRSMLDNGLGQLIEREAQSAERVVDLFSGSGAVSWYAAQHTNTRVLAADLQEYAVILARAVLMRTAPCSVELIKDAWYNRARTLVAAHPFSADAYRHGRADWGNNTRHYVKEARALCSTSDAQDLIFNSYGGYYFSPQQALILDALRVALPSDEPHRSVALAALISAASACAASPGHTAQPFQPTASASIHLIDAWRRDPFEYCTKALADICPRFAQRVGNAVVADATQLSADVRPRDLVVVDPPYSGVHYSRFYHVLETLARGFCGAVSGEGRYPSIDERPQSLFSVKSKSYAALANLLQKLAEKGAQVIVTFPAGQCSNGLSGSRVLGLASGFFRVEQQAISGKFSTLGGNMHHRPARQPSRELVLHLIPL